MTADTQLAGHLIVECLVAQGVRHAFGVPGESYLAVLDGFHARELLAWLRTGCLSRLDLVYSRDQAQRRYVQHVLEEAADDVRATVADGASIYVCGSLRGMAPAVDDALGRILGRETLEALAAEGRYRRDVY